MSRSEHTLCTVDGNGIILSLQIQPRASRNEVCGVQDNALKIRLTSPPVDGAANKLCREFIADIFGVSKSSVEIISGTASRLKRVRIIGGNPERLKKIVDDIVMSH
jgi:uncharacterized protein (TIGR00251 family)